MVQSSRVVKILIFIAVASYFAYAFYWFVKTIPYVVGISLGPGFYSPPAGLRSHDSYSVSIGYLTDYMSFLGLMVRVVGASYALLAAFLILKTETNFFPVIRDKISKALLIEGFYFLSFIPSIYFLLGFSALRPVSNALLSVQLGTQILLISPFFISLGLKVGRYELGVGASSLLPLAGLCSMNYVIALWVTYMLKWAEMTAVVGIGFKWLLTQPYVLGFLSTVIILSLSVLFAVVGILSILRKSDENKIIKWWGLSAIFLSSYFIIYVLYLASVGALYYAQLSEFWVIPLLGLGIYSLIYSLLKKPRVTSTSQIDQV